MEEVRPDESGAMDVTEPCLTLRGVRKCFGDFAAVDGIDLDIRQGEVFALLGPSGCGKSTTLRIIAGLEEPDSGLIRLRDRELYSSERGAQVPVQKRNMGMVFQSYAIWPHLSVLETVAYPLDVRRVSPQDKKTRALAAIKQVGLSGFEDRSASTLSGGQQQRVALARALVYEPHVLLLDEPFSNLDLRVREQMRIELKLLQRRLNISVVLVTHDQVEALSLSDRIAVMNQGRVEQIGTPRELYDRPMTPFVRDFIGAFAKFEGSVVAIDGDMADVAISGSASIIRGRRHESCRLNPGDRVVATIRPERIVLGGSDNLVTGKLEAALFTGDRYEAVLRIGDQTITTWINRSTEADSLRDGDEIRLRLPADDVVVWSA